MQNNWKTYYATKSDSQVFVPEAFVARFFLSKRPVTFDHDYSYENKAVLDIGCGSGRHLDFFTQLGLRATGLDLSISQVPEELAKRVTLLTGSLADLPNLSELYQFITCINSIYYCTSESELEGHLRSINERLEVGGHAVISFIGEHHFVLRDTGKAFKSCFEAFTSPATHQCGDNRVIVPFGPDAIFELFSRAGFATNYLMVGEVLDSLGGMTRHLHYAYAKKAAA